MSNLNGIPSADYFETRLANLWNGTVGTIYVDEVPSGSIVAGEYSYIVVNPGESNMQVAKVDGWDSDNHTFNVTDVVTPSGTGTNYTAKSHPLGSIVRFSNNYAFWKDIQDAVNSKADDSSISAVGKSNDYTDLDNTPNLSAVALSNDYNDLYNLPTPVSIAVGDKVLELSLSNELSATISASYDSGTKKITLYGANSAVISEIDCTAFIKDGMIQNVQIVTDPAGYAPGKYLEFDFNTDSGVTDIYIALSDLAVYTAGTGIDITSNAITLKKATTNSLGGVIVGSRLSVVDGTISADSQTDENYTTAEKSKLSGIESTAQVNKLEKVQVNGTDLPITAKAVNVQIKTINGNSLTGSGDLDLMARTYSAGTGIDITSDTISINSTYQTTIANKANSADLASVATSGNYSDLNGVPEDLSDFNNDTGFITAGDLEAGSNVQISGTTISATDTTYTASDFDIKDLADSTSKRSSWDAKLDSTAISDTNYGGAWNGDTTHAPSKNAVYTKLHTMDVEIGNKAADNSVVKLTGNQTVGGIKTFSSEIVLPSKTIDATNDGTKPATEAQVYKKQDSFHTSASSAPDTPSQGDEWYDTTNDVLKTYDGSNWNEVGGGGGGSGDMLKATYDPNNVGGDAFDYDNFINTPTIPSNTSDLNNDSGFITSASLPGTATSSTAGLVKLGSDTTQSVAANAVSSTASRTYGIQLNSSNQAVVNVPREDHTYTASSFDIKDLTDSTNLRTTWSGKQDALTLAATPTSGHLVTRGADNKTFADGGAIPTGFNPSNAGSTGDVLKKTAGGYERGTAGTSYADFAWQTKSGATIELSLNTYINEPSQDFTVNAPSTILDGMVYILRIDNGATAYTMTLGTNIDNSLNVDTTLSANGTDQFVFLAFNGQLELQPEVSL